MEAWEDWQKGLQADAKDAGKQARREKIKASWNAWAIPFNAKYDTSGIETGRIQCSKPNISNRVTTYSINGIFVTEEEYKRSLECEDEGPPEEYNA